MGRGVGGPRSGLYFFAGEKLGRAEHDPQKKLSERATHPSPPPRPYSVEILGSAWTFCGTIIKKLLVASAASPSTRPASSSWPVARSSLA